jgi:hypothetical protein
MNDVITTDQTLLERLWHDLGGPSGALPAVSFSGKKRGLPSVYEVSALASASIAAATLAVAELQATRTGESLRRVSIDRGHADAAFHSERHLTALGWEMPAIWDPLAGDYRTRDGFIRLHTNYAYHRDAALRVLGTGATRDAVTQATATWDGEALESAVLSEGGCAAMLRSPAEWRAHPQGQSLTAAPLIDVTTTPVTGSRRDVRGAAPLAGMRVLDLTRVIAGPIGTRVLAAYGADVLRIDPPGFDEVGPLLCDITAGKRRAALDLHRDPDRVRFESLVAQTDLIVHGYRADALARLGFGNDRLRALNPAAVIVCHDAYGWSGPWAHRRGFDSLVQMSCGIAWRGRDVQGGGIQAKPHPLPAQALDHATGYLIAAAACRALTRRLQMQQTSLVRLSLARTAHLLMDLGDLGAIVGEAPAPGAVQPYLEEAVTHFGPVCRVRCPGYIEGIPAEWRIPAGPLGIDPPRFG